MEFLINNGAVMVPIAEFDAWIRSRAEVAGIKLPDDFCLTSLEYVDDNILFQLEA